MIEYGIMPRGCFKRWYQTLFRSFAFKFFPIIYFVLADERNYLFRWNSKSVGLYLIIWKVYKNNNCFYNELHFKLKPMCTQTNSCMFSNHSLCHSRPLVCVSPPSPSPLHLAKHSVFTKYRAEGAGVTLEEIVQQRFDICLCQASASRKCWLQCTICIFENTASVLQPGKQKWHRIDKEEKGHRLCSSPWFSLGWMSSDSV